MSFLNGVLVTPEKLSGVKNSMLTKSAVSNGEKTMAIEVGNKEVVVRLVNASGDDVTDRVVEGMRYVVTMTYVVVTAEAIVVQHVVAI
jgi:hypothetical protein